MAIVVADEHKERETVKCYKWRESGRGPGDCFIKRVTFQHTNSKQLKKMKRSLLEMLGGERLGGEY